MKLCTKCNKEKPVTDFSPDSRMASGVRSHCKDCCKQWANFYRTEHPEKISIKRPENRRKNQQKRRAIKREVFIESVDLSCV